MFECRRHKNREWFEEGAVSIVGPFSFNYLTGIIINTTLFWRC